MKKYFLMATLALVTVALIGCKDKKSEETEDPGQQTEQTVKVVLSESELELAIGGEATLFATLSPAKNLEITWTTSDAKIATVDAEGVVTGVAAGTATITASAEGATAATCTVTVVDPLTQFAWAGLMLWGIDEDEQGNYIVMSNDTCEVELSDEMTVHCITVSASFRLWSEGVEFVEDHLEGFGNVVYLDNVPLWIITEALDENGPNYYYVNSMLEFVDPKEYDPTKAANACTAPCGHLVSLDQHVTWYNDESQTAEPGIQGSTVYLADYTNSRFYPFDGLMLPGRYLAQNDGTLYYNGYVAWSNGVFGFAINEDGTALKEPMTFATYTPYLYQKLPASEEAPARIQSARHQASAKAIKALTHKQDTKMIISRDIKGYQAAKKF